MNLCFYITCSLIAVLKNDHQPPNTCNYVDRFWFGSNNCYGLICFQDAKRDETARRAYKLLATLHSDCSELVQMVEETGATVREIRDLEEQVMQPY
jgi:hypothetical protein